MEQTIGRVTRPRLDARTAVKAEPGVEDLKRLRWFITIVPAVGMFLFETVRHGLFQNQLPTWEGNLLAGFMALAISATFSQVLFKTIRSLHRRTLADQQELVALNAVVHERERLSREMHDGLAQVVSYLLLRLDTVEELVHAGREADAAAELGKLRSLTDDLYADVRESISGLRSRVGDLGLMRALQEYGSEFEERHGITMTIQGAPPKKLSPAVEAQLFRIVQEALANVRKHSGASRADLTFGITSSGNVELVIADDGRGFDPALEESPHPGSFGLKCMRERAEEPGGSLQIESQVGHGTRIVVLIPVRGHNAGTQHEAATTSSR